MQPSLSGWLIKMEKREREWEEKKELSDGLSAKMGFWGQ